MRRSLTRWLKWRWTPEERALDAADVGVRRDLVPLLVIERHRGVKECLPVGWRGGCVMEELALAEHRLAVLLIFLSPGYVLVPDQVRVLVQSKNGHDRLPPLLLLFGQEQEASVPLLGFIGFGCRPVVVGPYRRNDRSHVHAVDRGIPGQ